MKLQLIFFVCISTNVVVICNGLSSTEHVGCYKVQRLENRCSLTNEDEEKRFTANITQSISNSIEWLRQQQQSHGSWKDLQTGSWIAQTMVVTGYVQDDGTCSKPLNDEMKKFKTTDVLGLTGGKLALLMIGLKATCGYDEKLKQAELAKALKSKMKAFAKGEFDNFYDFSLGIIALYVNSEQILDEFGSRLLRGIFIGKNKKIFYNDSRLISDTEAVGLIALTAISKQRFMGHWVRKHALREQTKAKKKIEYILKNKQKKKSLTLLQVLQAIDIKESAQCTGIMRSIMRKQSKDGSYDGQLSTTAHAILVLSGKSVLDLRREEHCPRKIDKVDVRKIKEYIKERQHFVEEVSKKEKRKIVKVTLKVQVDIPKFVAKKESIQIEIKEGECTLEALRRAWKKNSCFKFETQDSTWGDYIVDLCGLKDNHVVNTYWTCTVNGIPSNTGLSSYKPKDNDVILFKYLKLVNQSYNQK